MLATLNPAMSRIYKKIGRILNSYAPVLLRGESGCGKEVIAYALHHAGFARSRKLVHVHCETATQSSLLRDLFAAGATPSNCLGNNGKHTGAQNQTLAVDLLLKNIETLSHDLQSRLVQLLQEKKMRDPENGASLSLNLRLLATSRHDLLPLVEQGRFRQDLYYRLTTYEFLLPPLRERREDLPAFITHFLEKNARQNPDREIACSAKALAQLATHAWPGNLRELQETLARTILMLEARQTVIERICFLPRAEVCEPPCRKDDFAPQTVLHDGTYSSAAAPTYLGMI